MMTADQILAFAPIAVPATTALIGLFVPSPGPTVAKWSSAWWASVVRVVAGIWQSKPVQAEVALEISPTMQAVINQAVAVALAAVTAQSAVKTPANVWLAATPAVQTATTITP